MNEAYGNKVFFVNSGTASISGLTITDGGTGIQGGSVSYTGVTFTGITGTNGIEDWSSPVTVIDSTFTNIAGGTGGAIYCQTGGTVTVTNSTFTGNSGSGSGNNSGGAIETNGCNLVVSGSTFIDNFTAVSGVQGGAIQSGSGGTVSVTNSTFEGNSAPGGDGGAIANWSTGTLANNTFSGNSAANGNGGAIYSDAALTVNNNIFTGNSAGQGAGIFDGNNVVTAGYNVFYNNLAGGSESDCSGCSSTNSSFGVNPKLLPLGSYGGTTETLALAPGSPAVCEGNSADAVNAGGNPLTTDQRGFALDPTCSSGNVDAGAVQTNQYVVTTLADNTDGSPECATGTGTTCSLRDAIGLANTTPGDITFLSSLTSTSSPGTISLGTGSAGDIELPSITGQMNILGPGANQLAVSGNNDSVLNGIFRILSGATTLYGLTVTDGNGSSTLGGGGIYSDGTLTVIDSAVSGNHAYLYRRGGGIDSDGNGTLTVIGSTISGNTAGEAGGIFSLGPLTVTDSTIYGNRTEEQNGSNGGGIFSYGSFTLTGSTVSGNSASRDSCASSVADGGGILVGTGTVTLVNSIVAGNSASVTGDGSASYADISGNYTLAGGGGSVVGTSTTGTSNVNPQLSPLQYNGIGVTLQTVMPLPGSPAICAGLVSNIPSGTTTDERGYPLQPTNGYCPSGTVDAGAAQTNYTSLAFVQQPADSTASVPGTAIIGVALSPSPTVDAVETDTLLSTNNTDAVNLNNLTATLALTDNDGALESGSTQSVSGGVVAFNGLTFNGAATGDTLTASLTVTPNTVSPAATITGASYGFNVGTASTTTAVGSLPVVTFSSTAQVLSLSANVSSSVTVNKGTVTFTIMEGAATIGTATSVTVAGGTASASYTLPAGTDSGAYTIEAVYTDSTGSFTSSSGAATLAVNGSGYPTSVIPQAATTVHNTNLQSVTLEALLGGVGGPRPSGTVYFTVVQGSTVIGSTTPASVATGIATTSYSLPGGTPVGTYTIQAYYTDSTGTYAEGYGTSTLTVTLPTYTVTTAADDSGSAANCTSGGSSCSLRDALLAASAAGGANIQFALSAFGSGATISPTYGTLNIPSGTTIQGLTSDSGDPLKNLVTVSGGTAQLFAVKSGVTGAAIANLIITGASNNGIYNQGAMTVSGSTFSGNGTNGSGGAIFSDGTLTVTSSTFSGNSAGGGGGIYSDGTLTVTGTAFSGNSASAGASIYNSGTLTVTSSTFSGNSATQAGGGIYNSGTLTLAGSTFPGNSAPQYGGGGIYNSNTLTVSNSIFTQDSSGGECGGSGCPSSGGNGNLVDPAGTQASLASLGYYGGPTQTLIPLPGSAAICGGLQADIPNGVTTDQRGEPNTNTTYPGYSAGTACVDSGAVQTNYSLAFASQPPATVSSGANMSPSPAVQLDESGAPIALGGANISMTAAMGTLSGTTTESTAGSGLATFDELFLGPAETDDTLAAHLTLNSALSLAVSASSSQFNAQAVAPAVTLVAPTTGPSSGGSAVTITGTNLGGATVVSFGGAPAPSFTVTSATQITAAAPAGAGTADVTVTTPSGTSATSPADQFTYVAPIATTLRQRPRPAQPLSGASSRPSPSR